MLIGLLHYHLRGGGVTRVIESTAKLLKEYGHEVVVVCGEETNSDAIDTIITHNALGYEATPNKSKIPEIASDLDKVISRVFGRTPDLWHIHNHSLGKNTTVPQLVTYWANQQIPILLQIHDFAEDGRAKNYHFLRQNLTNSDRLPLYPTASHIHYATLTKRDQRMLNASGFQNDRLHVLPNPVSMEQNNDWGNKARSLFPECETLVLYPVRGIRRKNLGEFLLHSIIAEPDTHFAITLEPQNQKQLRFYKQWVAYAQSKQLPVTFEAGHQQKYPFPAIVQAADILMTSSITEGFGLTFLEAWLMNRPICGRDLPDITVDFKENGIQLDHLYSLLPIPIDWFSVSDFLSKIEEGLREMYKRYDREYRKEYLGQFEEAVIQNGTIDFGRLDEELQQTVLERLVSDTNACEELQTYALQRRIPSADVIAHNKELVNKDYNPEAYYTHLMNIYGRLLNAESGSIELIDPEKVLDRFLKPERFYLIKSD